MKKWHFGFTLIELLVVVAIVAILASLAVPSFNTMLMKRSVQGAAQALVSDMRFARSEALRRSMSVSICSLAANSTNTCAAGGGASWVNGWMVFSDVAAANPVVFNSASGDEIVRVQQPLANLASIASTVPSSDKQGITFEAHGRSKSAGNQTFIFTPRGTVPAGTVRIVCVSSQGRVRLLDEGATACPT